MGRVVAIAELTAEPVIPAPEILSCPTYRTQMTAIKAPSEILPQPQARGLCAADLPALVGRPGVQLLGIDMPPTVPAAKTFGVIEFPAPTSTGKGLADLLADAVVARLRAAGAIGPNAAANETPPAVTSSTLAVTSSSSSTSSMLAGSSSTSSALTPQAVASASSALDEPPPILLSTTAAAKLLGCTVKAIFHRISERHIPSSCVVRSGRRIFLHRERLLAAMDRKAGR